MKHKNISPEMTRDYIAEAVLLLLEKKDWEDISVTDIAARAGVNRSTFYRNFASREDAVRRFYAKLLERGVEAMGDTARISVREYLSRLFASVYEHKDALLRLHRAGLSHLMLGAMNELFLQKQAAAGDFAQELAVFYHTGGIFNSFLLWFEKDMSIPSEEFAAICAAVYPAGKKPMLAGEVN